MTDESSCAVPGCKTPRNPIFLGWHENDAITSAYCDDHGPRPKTDYCSECGTPKSSKLVWPDGIPPAGVVNGKVGTVTAP